MAVRIVFFLLGCCLLATAPVAAQSPTTGSSSARVDSYVQGSGTGTVTLKPTLLRLSIPIKIVSEASWDATEQLRTVRREVEERAIEMGAIDGSMRVVGYQCFEEPPPSITITRGETSKPKYAARCYLVADFVIREMQDQEGVIAVCQAQLEELAALIPKEDTRRRSYSFSTLSSGLTTQQLESPLAFFVAPISDGDRSKAFKDAMDQANAQVRLALDAIGIESPTSISLQQHSTYSSSRAKHPVETEIYRTDKQEAVGMYADAVPYTVRIGINAKFDLPE